MHELSIAKEIIKIVDEIIPQKQKKEIEFVLIHVGKNSNIVASSLEFSLVALLPDTDFPQAKFIMKSIPISIYCPICEKDFSMVTFQFFCPTCQSSEIEVTTGNELEVKEIKLKE